MPKWGIFCFALLVSFLASLVLSENKVYAVIPPDKEIQIALINSSLTLDTIYDYDIGVESILSPRDSVARLPITPSIVVKNYGSLVASSFQAYFRVFDSLGNHVYTNARSVISLLPDSVQIVIFNPWTPVTGIFVVKSFTNFSQDQNHSNDTLTDTIWVYWRDVGVTQIIEPVGGYSRGCRAEPKAWVKNFGDTEESDVPVIFSIYDPPYLDTLIVPVLLPGDSVLAVFDSITMRPGLSFPFFWTALPGDMDPENDTLFIFYGGEIDVQAQQILSPIGNISKDTLTAKPVQAKVKNNEGSLLATFWTYFGIYQGATQVYYDSALTIRLAPGVEATLNFTPYLANDTGFFTTKLKIPHFDPFPENDSILGSFRVVHGIIVDSIISPRESVPRFQPVTPSIVITNYTPNTAPSFQAYLRIYDMFGTLCYSSQRMVVGLLPDSSRTLAFVPWIPTDTGYYEIQAIIPGDSIIDTFRVYYPLAVEETQKFVIPAYQFKATLMKIDQFKSHIIKSEPEPKIFDINGRRIEVERIRQGIYFIKTDICNKKVVIIK